VQKSFRLWWNILYPCSVKKNLSSLYIWKSQPKHSARIYQKKQRYLQFLRYISANKHVCKWHEWQNFYLSNASLSSKSWSRISTCPSSLPHTQVTCVWTCTPVWPRCPLTMLGTICHFKITALTISTPIGRRGIVAAAFSTRTTVSIIGESWVI